MNESEVFEKIKSIFVEKLDLEDGEFRPEASLRDDLGASSLELVDLVMEFEKQTGVNIDLEELNGIDTVDDVLKLVGSKIKSE